MKQHKIETLQEYLQFVQQAPEELDSLFAELLIGVTRFFRDAEAFKALADLCLAPLFAGRAADDPVRVWCVGCSTGEEAYSVAMLLAEHAQAAGSGASMQIFATDVDKRAVAAGRAGVYPADIAVDVSPERLARFFTAEPTGGWRVQRRIRDSVIFSEQDVLMDPPFSRLDLLVCRNVMIYFDEQLQKRLIPLFHYALKPGGTLFLGSAEGIGEFGELFSALDRSAKVYRREPLAAGRRAVQQRFVLPSIAGTSRAAAAAVAAARPASLREMAERALLAHLEPVAALVTAIGDVAYLHGRSGLFLEPAQGDAPAGNILHMAREGLAPALGVTLQKAVLNDEVARASGVRVKTNGEYSLVDLVVRPLAHAAATSGRPLFLVVLSLSGAPPMPALAGQVLDPTDASAQHIAQLQAELQAKDEYLLSTNDQLQRANEELTSINEEAQSINEELQSTNEELETSKEELQSVNEELVTANTELEDKIHRLTQTNNDMNNLLAGTGIGTLFVDLGLCVLRFTPALSAIINLIPGDTGRPLAHIASNLVGYATLVPDCQAVLDSLVPQAREVQTTDGRWYMLRIQPYRTLENVIEGAVISFIEITESVRTRDELKRVNAYMRYAAVLRDTADAIAVQSLDGHILAWNPAAERLYGWTEAEALLLQADDRIPPALRDDERKRLVQVAGTAPMQAHRSQRLTKDGSLREVSVLVLNLLDETGAVYAVAITERAIVAARP
jgi:two-component system CheB/CheR fusion protein